MTFSSVELARIWSKKHGKHIYVEVEGAPGVLEVYPGGRAVFVDASKGKIYERWRGRLTPDEEFEQCRK